PRSPPLPPLFPYTTLFRSPTGPGRGGRPGEGRCAGRGPDPGAPGRVPAGRLRFPVGAAGAAGGGTGGRTSSGRRGGAGGACPVLDRKSTRLNSSHVAISYA